MRYNFFCSDQHLKVQLSGNYSYLSCESAKNAGLKQPKKNMMYVIFKTGTFGSNTHEFSIEDANMFLTLGYKLDSHKIWGEPDLLYYAYIDDVYFLYESNYCSNITKNINDLIDNNNKFQVIGLRDSKSLVVEYYTFGE